MSYEAKFKQTERGMEYIHHEIPPDYYTLLFNDKSPTDQPVPLSYHGAHGKPAPQILGGGHNEPGRPTFALSFPPGIFSTGRQYVLNFGTWVCETFHGPRPIEPDGTPYDVSHLDGNKYNNRPDNVKWETKAQNAEREKERSAARVRDIGRGHPKYPDPVAAAVKWDMARRGQTGDSRMVIAERHAVSQSFCRDVHRGVYRGDVVAAPLAKQEAA